MAHGAEARKHGGGPCSPGGHVGDTVKINRRILPNTRRGRTEEWWVWLVCGQSDSAKNTHAIWVRCEPVTLGTGMSIVAHTYIRRAWVFAVAIASKQPSPWASPYNM